MSSFVTANFAKGRVCVTPSVFQYNAGMKLRFLGASLPGTYRVDFSNTLHGKSKPMIGNADGVEIPYEYFVPGQSIYAWIVVSFGEGGTITEYQATIPVSPRAKPTNETPSPAQQSAIDQAIAALNEGVTRAEAAADSAEETVAGVQETVDAALETAKESGEFDGVSPTVDVALITGGHRITITDADGSHIVDVMDGTDGRGIVSVEKTGTAGLVDTYTIIYTDGTTATFTVTNGKDGDPGTPGQDGVSPTISVTDITGGHRVTITDAQGTETFDVMDGAPGAGVPAGGTTGQVLSKASGTDYDTAWVDKNPVVQVSGSTPSITALPGVRYVCGEVATLDLTLPASDIVDVVFESGSTPAVLTITPPTGVTLKWANGFDPDTLDANTTYELRIMDGKNGVAVNYSATNDTENEYNHVSFAVLDESEQTTAFIIENNKRISEFLIEGKALFDSYDGLWVFINDKNVLAPSGEISAQNCNFRLYGHRILTNEWIGRGVVSQWALNSTMLINNATAPGSEITRVDTGNIRISSRWKNKIFQVGTHIDVYWR